MQSQNKSRGQFAEQEHNKGDTAQHTDRMLSNSLKQLAGLLSEQARQAVYDISILHSFDEKFIRSFLPVQMDILGFLDELKQLQLIQSLERGRYRLHSLIRDHFLNWLCLEQPTRFLELSQKARDLYADLSQTSSLSERQMFREEYLYHELVCDETVGLDFLSLVFEKAMQNFQFGMAENYVKQLVGQKDQLSEAGKPWLDYYLARLDLSYRRFDRGEEKLQPLLDASVDRQIRGLSLWSLGDLHLENNHWADAFARYKESLVVLGTLDPSPLRGYVLLSFGKAHVDLANNCGGINKSTPPQQESMHRYFYLTQNLPFLFIEKLQRSFGFFPQGWYAGTNYQDWIIYFLFIEANHCYQDAREYFRQTDNLEGEADALLAMADIERVLGRWSTAEDYYDHLLDLPSVLQSPYRIAKVHLGQGWLYFSQKQFPAAVESLTKAVDTLRGYPDDLAFAEAVLWQGRVFQMLGQFPKAAQAFLDRLQALERYGDNIDRTQAVLETKGFLEDQSLNNKDRVALKAEIDRLDEHQYIARFPLELLRWFRRMSLLFALPVTYLLLLVLAAFLTQALMIVEFSITELFVAGHFPVLSMLNYLTLLVYLLLPVPLAMWIYRLMYSIAGVFFVKRFGKKLVLSGHTQVDQLRQSEPDVITTNDEMILIENPSRKPTQLAWKGVKKLVSVDYSILGQPIRLLSRLIIQDSKEAEHFIEGNTNFYEHLKEFVVKKLAGVAEFHNLDLEIIPGLWSRVILVFSAIYALFVVWVGQVQISGGYDWQDAAGAQGLTQLWVSSFVVVFLFTTLAIAPAGVLWRFYAHRRKLHRLLDHQATAVSNRTLLIAAICSTLLALLWLFFWILVTLDPVVEESVWVVSHL